MAVIDAITVEAEASDGDGERQVVEQARSVLLNAKRFMRKQYQKVYNASLRFCRRHYWIGLIVLCVLIFVFTYLISALVATPVLLWVATFSTALFLVLYVTYFVASVALGYFLGVKYALWASMGREI